MTKRSPFTVMFYFFGGLATSVMFGFSGALLVYYLDGQLEAVKFFNAYTAQFKTLISLGLILGTAVVVYFAQKDVPEMIEEVFRGTKLPDAYYLNKRHFWSLRKTIVFCGYVSAVAFVVFRYCEFPLTGAGYILMMVAVCAEYAFACFVGRKLRYTAMMLNSLSEIDIARNLFKERELDRINWYVNIASTLTIIFVYVHVTCYFHGPFEYGSPVGSSMRIFLILPAVMATPVLLIFNFYPREVFRKLYSKSIDLEIKNLKLRMSSENLSAFEKRSYLVEFNKMSRDELRYGIQLALTDLPIGITILAMIVQTLLK